MVLGTLSIGITDIRVAPIIVSDSPQLCHSFVNGTDLSVGVTHYTCYSCNCLNVTGDWRVTYGSLLFPLGLFNNRER